MSSINFNHRRQQWPVGHGFFHTASVQFDGDIYRYVYDCGAGTPETIKSQIDRYASNEQIENNRNAIDMVVVSHFHNDHINGLPHFLQRFNVKKLVVPYLAEDHKLVALASMAAHSVETWSALSGLLIDPQAWLRARNPDAELIEVSNSPPDGEQRETVPLDLETGLSLGVGKISHHQHGSIFLQKIPLWNFKFYVQESWGICILVFCGLIEKFKPCSESKMKSWLSDPKWIQDNHSALKDVFKDIDSGRQNVTTLCMYSGIEVSQCPWFEEYLSSSSHGPLRCPHLHRHRSWHRLGWLGTGDAKLNSNGNMKAFEKHYADYLKRVDTLTIPHHGSIGNYNGKLGDIGFRHVITADHAIDPKGHHPSKAVILNLNTKSDYTHIATLEESTSLFDRIRGLI